MHKKTNVQILPTLNICTIFTRLFANTIAFGGVPIGNNKANDIDKATGVNTANGECP